MATPQTDSPQSTEFVVIQPEEEDLYGAPGDKMGRHQPVTAQDTPNLKRELQDANEIIAQQLQVYKLTVEDCKKKDQLIQEKDEKIYDLEVEVANQSTRITEQEQLIGRLRRELGGQPAGGAASPAAVVTLQPFRDDMVEGTGLTSSDEVDLVLLPTRVEELEQTVQDQEATIQRKVELVQILTKDAAALRAEVSALKRRLEASDRSRPRLEDADLEELRKELTKEKDVVGSLSGQLQASHEEFTKTKAQLQAQLAGVTQEREELQQQVLTLRRQLQERDLAARAQQDTDDVIQRLRAERQTLQAQVVSCQEDLAASNNKLITANKQVRELEHHLEEQVARERQLAAQAQQTQEQELQGRHGNQQAEAQLRQVEQQRADLDRKVKLLENVVKIRDGELRDREAERVALATELVEVKVRLREREGEEQVQQQQLEHHRAQVALLQANQRAELEQVRRAAAQAASRGPELERAREAAAQAQEEVVTLTARLQASELMNTELDRQIDELNTEKMLLKRTVMTNEEDFISEREDRTRAAAHAREAQAQAEQATARLRVQVDHLGQQLEETRNENAAYRDQLALLMAAQQQQGQNDVITKCPFEPCEFEGNEADILAHIAQQHEQEGEGGGPLP